MKKILITPLIAGILLSCAEKEKPIVLDFDQQADPVVYTDQMRFAYVDRTQAGIYNLASQSVEWSWTVQDTPLMKDYKDYFSTLDEVKPVNRCEDLLICSNSGGVAMIHIADKSVKFFALPMGQPHSIELLPDGNIVVACSVSGTVEGNMLKVYKVDPQHPFVESYSGHIANYSGHNVVWDNYNDVLWATADDVINMYSYAPATATLKLYKSIPLPQSNAHELFPVYGEEKMWLTTSGMRLFRPSGLPDADHLSQEGLLYGHGYGYCRRDAPKREECRVLQGPVDGGQSVLLSAGQIKKCVHHEQVKTHTGSRRTACCGTAACGLQEGGAEGTPNAQLHQRGTYAAICG